MALKGNAAFLVDGPSGEQVYLCNVPPRIVSTRNVTRRETEESLSRQTYNVVTFGAPVYELTLRCRFADRPHDLLALLDAAANGYSITYIHDLTQPGAGTTFTLIHGDDAIEATPDPDRYGYGEYDTTLTLRSSTSFAPLLASSDILFRYHAGGATDALTFARASTAYRINRSGVLESVASDVLRTEWLDLDGDGVRETPTTLVEGARTNVLYDSSNFADAGTAWSGASGFTVATAASIIDGQTAYRHTNLGAATFRLRAQARGQFTGSPETAYAIIEGDDAAVSELSIYDNTTASHVARARWTWATESASIVSGSGTAYGRVLTQHGPNGGPVVLLAVTATGTAGNDRVVAIYPSGADVNTEAAILHHAQHEEADGPSSVVVTGSAAGEERALDLLTAPFTAPPQSLARYQRFVEGGAVQVANARTGQIGSDTGLHRYSFQVSTHPSSGVYQATIGNGTTFVSSTGAAAPDVDDEVEHLALLEIDGTDARVRLLQTIEGEDASGDWSSTLDVSALLAQGWEAETLTVGNVAEGTRAGRILLRDDIVLRGSSWSLSDVRRLLP